MKPKALIPLVLAVVLGLMAFFIGRRVLNNQANAAPARAGVKVLVASGEFPAGHQLAETDYRLADAPVESITATMFRKPEELKGRILIAPTEAGQVIRASMLASAGTQPGLQSKVPAGMRAVTIAVNEFSGLAGLLVPGVKVDLVATLVDNVTTETFAKTIVQNVEVSAVGQELDVGQMAKNDPRGSPRTHKTVTLLVTPTQAAAIDLAFSKSKPRLVLRSIDDEAPVNDEAVTMAELSGRAREDRMAVTAKDESSNKVMDMLATMQKQIQDVSKASQEAARQAAEEMAQQASGAQPGQQEPTSLHSVRVFRGGAETREQFNADGSAAGTNSGKPAAAPAKETQRVEAPAGQPAGQTAAAE